MDKPEKEDVTAEVVAEEGGDDKPKETDNPKDGPDQPEAEAPRTRPKRKAAEKSVSHLKKAKKEREEKGKKSGSGFSKPVKVSEELADFIGQDEISRPQLTKFMWAYFKENGLQDPTDKRHIIADDKLKDLLKVDRFNAFGFMKLVKPHFIG